jgi:signal transduction histidine kinase
VDVDPRDPKMLKIFSVAAVENLGYIYVILGSQQYRSVTQMLFNSRITPMVLGSVLFLLAVSLLITVYTIQRMRERDNIRRLTASEKERRDFMVNISHDLRTPLAIARGYTETLLLKKGELTPEEEQSYGDLALTKLRQVEKMVNQLFELSKMESASFEAHREPFVFSEMMQEVVSALEAGTPIELINGQDGSWIEADVSMMERVVQNLVVNALAYTSAGGGIRIRLRREGADLIFSITNQGSPLPDDLVAWLNGEEGAMRPSAPAIGLSIVRRILQLHHYPWKVETNAGVNVFTIRMGIYR